MKLSIITPSIRKKGLEIVKKSLLLQTYTDWEWIIGSSFNPEIKEAIWAEDTFLGGYWTLNRMYNKLFKNTRGELIISWQDFIYIPPTGLEQFVRDYEKTHGFITGVGDQYESLDDFGRPYIKIWSDPRKRTDLGSFYEVNFTDCEWNFAALPRKDIFSIGGMDEALDFLGYGGDQFQICDRLNDAGKHFFIDQANESYTLRHGRERKDWDKNHILFNGQYQKRKLALVKEKKWPVLDFLQK